MHRSHGANSILLRLLRLGGYKESNGFTEKRVGLEECPTGLIIALLSLL